MIEDRPAFSSRGTFRTHRGCHVPLEWVSEMFLIKFTLVAAAALLCGLFAIAPLFGPLRAESTQSAVNAGILRAMATRGAIHAILDDGARIQ